MSTRFFPNYNRNYITSRFGNRKWNGAIKHHNGIDLVALTDKGGHVTDYITAHTGGTVEEVGYTDSVGNFVSVRVCKSTVMVYYHLKAKSKLKEGETIKKGATIGYMGSTGNSTGAHLHFGIKENGKWIDPEPYLDADYPVTDDTEGVRNPYTMELKSLRKGCKGDDVKALQILLIGRGYSCGDKGADGSFGAATEKAVLAYQQAKGLEADGIAGKATMSRLLGV